MCFGGFRVVWAVFVKLYSFSSIRETPCVLVGFRVFGGIGLLYLMLYECSMNALPNALLSGL